MIDKYTRLSLLYDFYGALLTARQRQVLILYHEENLSLGEIAEEFSISRQGVHDALKNAEIYLNEYEDKLGLVEKFNKQEMAIKGIDEKIEKLLKETDKNTILNHQLRNIKDIIDKLND